LKKQHFLEIMPLQTKTNEIVVGERVPTLLELADADQFLNDEEKKQKTSALVAEPLKHFWS
jgi:hypothetical protein